MLSILISSLCWQTTKRCKGEEINYTGVFWRGRQRGAHMWWKVPAQEMLLCNLPGTGRPGGAEPKPRDARALPTAIGTPEDTSVAHDAT